MFVCVRVRVCVRERERERDRVTVESAILIAACVCVCVCERERDRVTSQRSVQPARNRLNRGLFANTYEHHHCLSRDSVPLSGWN